MNQNPMSEPIFADDVSDRSRHVSAPGNAAGPGLATAAAPRSQAPVSTLPEASGALPAGPPATQIREAAAGAPRRFPGAPGLEDGAPADLLVVPADPREDHRILRERSHVVLGGRQVA